MRNTKRVISMILAVCMLLSVLPLSAFALTVNEKPANGKTVDQPFPTGTADSRNFRIPGIVTLDNGTLIAVSDARWSTTSDNGGLDTIVSVSKDNGANWTYTFANYLGDNGDTYSNLSSCFIDPAIATDGTTAYLIADLFPAGFAIHSNARYYAQTGSTGFDAKGNMILRSDADNNMTFGSDTYASDAAAATYGYYLSDGKIYTTAGAEVEGYSVDAYFNITYTDAEGNEVKTNLFFEDSPYKPFPTNYLYMTTSTDGLKWSEPTLLNLKAEDERVLLVGPGSGIAVGDRMVFTAYEYTNDGNSQRTCLIWRDANGGWHRSDAATTDTWSSEASVVDLGGGKLRVFYRDGNSYLSYTDFNWSADANNYVRDTSATSVATAAAKRSGSGCMLSAFKYSQKIEDKDVILVSTPANSGARANGYLYVFLVDPEDKSMELAYAYDIIPNQDEVFAYSCITEMKSGDLKGDIALLYESQETNPGKITFSTIDMDDVTAYKNDARLNFIDVDLYLGETWTHKDTTGNYTLTDYTSEVANVTVSGTTATVPAATTMYSGTAVALADCLYTLTETDNGCYLHHTLSDGTEVYVDAHAGSGNIGYPNRTYTSELTLVNSTNTTDAIVITDATGSLHLHKEEEPPRWNQCGSVCSDKHDLLFFRPVESGETESKVFAGYVQVTDVADLEDGGQYLIAAKSDADAYYVLSPANGGGSASSNDHLAKVTGNAEISSSVITIEARTEGTTTVQIGSNVYTITVSEIPAVEVEVKENQTVTETVPGAYFASDISGLDTNYATVELAVTGATVSGLLPNLNTTVTMADSEYTFTDADSGTWYATIEKDDDTFYVRPLSNGHSGEQTALTLEFNTDGSVFIKSFYTGTKYYYLYVDRSTLAWNKINSSDSSTLSETHKTNSTFYIYGEGEDASSPIPGYKLITSNDQITSTKGYLIAFYDNAKNLYVMNPSDMGAGAKQQMAQVVVDGTAATTTISITGVAEGTTSLILGDDEYEFNITVRDENYDPIAIPETEKVYKGSAITVTEKPKNGTTVGQPFLTGTGGSTNFRIPGIVTLDNGTLIAVSDARWNGTADAGGLDTIVSVSKDNGANWTYTFANYLGDNGNVWYNQSSCIIDPAIATDGTTAYLIADLFPAGFAINSARYSAQDGSTGFNDAGNLLLRDLASDTVVIGADGYETMAATREYNYYLDLETHEIRTANGTLCEGFTVDEYFNISYTDAAGTTHKTNLFFADSPFQPFPADYLYMTTSTDGLNWSEPTLLNLKAADEQTLLIGPGNGTYNKTTKHMVFTAYEYDFGTQNTALVWKDTDGKWYRSENVAPNNWTSEATAVALSDGTVRVFYRDGYSVLRYTDMVWDEDTHNYVRDDNATEISTTAPKRYNNQLTSIVYSKQIEGKDVILVACAANPDARSDGHLYVFLVNEDKTMELAYDYDIVPNTVEGYAYNCISEMEGGNIALLYEGDYAATSGSGEIIFTTIDMQEVTDRDNDARLNFVDVTVLTEEFVTVTDSTGDYTGADTSELVDTVATVDMTVTSKTTMSAQLGSDANYTGTTIDLANCLYTFTKDESGNWVINSGDVYLNTNGTLGYPHSTESATFTIETGNEEGTFYIRGTGDSKGAKNYLYFDRSAYKWDRVNGFNPNHASNATWMANCSMSLFKPVDGEGSGQISGYERVTSLEDVTDGQYLIGAKGANGNWYVAYPTTDASTRYSQIAKVASATTIHTTHITFTGVGEGYSEVLIGSTVYRVTVKDFITEEVSVTVGDSITIDTTYTGELAGLDTTYATAELAEGVLTITGVYPGTAYVDLGRTRYNITVNGSVVKVDLTEGETASYVVSGTNVDMTQPDEDVVTTGFGTGYGAQLGSAQSTYAGAYTALENLLYTFADNGNGTWTVSSTTADGTTVYLEPYATSNGNGYPNVTSPVAVTLSQSSTDNAVYLYGNGGYLHFHRSSNLYFDRVQSSDGSSTAISFLLYRPAAENETSSTEIPGFVLVEGKDAVIEGKYLIVAAYNDNYYMLYPTLSTAHRSAQVAHLVDNATTLDITAAGAGETSFRVESTVYEVTVSHNYDESGFCTVCHQGTAWDPVSGDQYGSVAEALREAEAGETVQLLTDCTEGYVLVTPDVTLDLNGYKLTADYVVSLGEADVIDRTHKGLLVVAQNSIVLDEGNEQVPVWNGTGYLFSQSVVDSTSTGLGLTLDEQSNVAYFSFVTYFNSHVKTLLSDGGTNNDVAVVVRLSWNSADGDIIYQDFIYRDEQVGTVVSGGYKYTLSFTGYSSLKNLEITPMVLTEAGAESVGTGHSVP